MASTAAARHVAAAAATAVASSLCERLRQMTTAPI